MEFVCTGIIKITGCTIHSNLLFYCYYSNSSVFNKQKQTIATKFYTRLFGKHSLPIIFKSYHYNDLYVGKPKWSNVVYACFFGFLFPVSYFRNNIFTKRFKREIIPFILSWVVRHLRIISASGKTLALTGNIKFALLLTIGAIIGI